MPIFWLTERMTEWRERPAIVWHDEPASYGSLLDLVGFWKAQLDCYEIERGAIVALEADYSPKAIALLLSLLDRAAIVVPLPARSVLASEFMDITEAQMRLTFDEQDGWQTHACNATVQNTLTRSLVELGQPGIVIFSSGSTGKPKASLHNAASFLRKFRSPRAALRTLAVPTMDHVAGLDTLFYTLSSGGTLIAVPERTPYSVCQAIDRYKAELLPASATFLNLLLISEAYQQFDLSSLRVIAYGSEVLAEHTLNRLNKVFPKCKLINKYGTTEMGSPRTRCKEDGSLWIKFDTEGFQTKVVDGVLWIRGDSAMMGYLNAPNPFEEGGWFQTGDAVEVDGEYVRILGRKSEMINVGGEKLYPVEVENVIQSMEGVEEVTVSADKNPITGEMVKAQVKLGTNETLAEFRKRMQLFCADKLPRFKIPQKVTIVNELTHGERFKKMREIKG